MAANIAECEEKYRHQERGNRIFMPTTEHVPYRSCPSRALSAPLQLLRPWLVTFPFPRFSTRQSRHTSVHCICTPIGGTLTNMTSRTLNLRTVLIDISAGEGLSKRRHLRAPNHAPNVLRERTLLLQAREEARSREACSRQLSTVEGQ